MHPEDHTTKKIALIVGLLSLAIGSANTIWKADPSVVIKVQAWANLYLYLLLIWLALYISQKSNDERGDR